MDAFPTFRQIDSMYGKYQEGEAGMTLRDYFAAKAIAVCPLSLPTDKANWSYQMADAMLKAREKKHG